MKKMEGVGCYLTVTLIVAVCVKLGLLVSVPVIVIVYVALFAEFGTFMVMVEVPAAVMEVGLKVQIMPAGAVALRVTVPV
jgi:hypothetical protein